MMAHFKPDKGTENLKYLFLLTIVSIFAAQGYAQIADIIDLHHNDANGVPAAPYNIGSSVTIEGIVTCGTNVYSSSNFEIFLQDATAGVNAFEYQSMPADVNVGDVVYMINYIFKGGPAYNCGF